MTLKHGKKQVNLNRLSNTVPYQEAKSMFSTVVENFAPTLKRMEEESLAAAQANYFHKFDIETRDYFVKLNEEFKHDPTGMKEAADAYSSTVLQSVPASYKLNAQAKLNGWSSNSVVAAAANKIKLDNNNLLSDHTITWDNQNNDIDYSFFVASELGMDGITKLNSSALDGMLLINDKAKKDLDLLVNGKAILSGEKHDLNVETNVKNLLISRGFHLMRAIGDDNKARAWLNEYANLKDKYAITITEEFKNNPVYKMTNDLMKNSETREEIIEAIAQKYESFHEKNIMDLKNSYQDVNINGEEQVGGALYIDNFQGLTNATDYMEKNFSNVKPTDYNKILNIVNKNMEIQSWVTKAIDSKKAHQFVGTTKAISDDKALFKRAILARYGIHSVDDANVDSSNLTNAVNILKENGLKPDFLFNYLKTTNIGDMTIDANLNDFKNQIALTRFLKSIYPGYEPTGNKKLVDAVNMEWDRNDQYLISQANGWTAKSEKAIVDTKNKIFNVDNKKYFEEALFNWMDARNVTDDASWFGTLFDDEKNQWSDHVALGTVFAWDAESTITGPIKHMLLSFVSEELANVLPEGADPTDPAYAKYLDGAIYKSFNRLKDMNYYPTRYSGHDQPILMKNSFEKWYPSVNGDQLNNEVYAHIFSKYDLANNKELTEIFNKGYMAEQELSKFKLTHSPISLITKSKEERKAGVEKWTAEMNKWYALYDEMVAENEKIIAQDWDGMNPMDILKTIFDNGGQGIILEPKGNLVELNGRKVPAYHLALKLPNGQRIDITDANEHFSPEVWSSLSTTSENTPKSHSQFINNLATQEYEEFMKHYGHLVPDWNWAKRAIHGTINVAQGMGNWRYYPDYPGVDDVPAEVRPFAWMMKVMGVDVDYRDLQLKMKKATNDRNELISTDQKIANNMDLSNNEKSVEALVPFWKMPYTKNNLDLTYKTYAKENYNNQEMNLGLRTNNYFGVHWVNEGLTGEMWDGQLEYKVDGNTMAVFSSPEHAARAAAKIIINKSSLVSAVSNEYGATPTLKEIFSMYAKDPSPYFKVFKEFGFNENDTVNILNANEMHGILKMIMNVEMGRDVVKEHFPKENQLLLNAIIFRGIESAYTSYNGTLGKVQ